MPHFQYAYQEHCISEQNSETNQEIKVVLIYTCQGRNNLNTLMYFNSLTLYNHILFSNNYRYILFTFFSSPELAQGELLGYRDVRRTCGRP